MKSVKAKLQEKGASAETITEFEKGAQAFVKGTIIPKFSDYEFYTGESMDPDGMSVFSPPLLPVSGSWLTYYAGLLSSITVLMALRHFSLSGSMVWMR